MRCWTGHIASDCKAPRRGNNDPHFKGGKNPRAQQVQSSETPTPDDSKPQHSDEAMRATLDDPRKYLLSDSEGEEPVVSTREVRVQDKGSHPQSVQVVVAGVPVDGIVDTAVNISIIGAEVFKRIAAVAKLRKRDLKPADKTPRNYDHKPFHLDRQLQGKMVRTQIYLKMDAHVQLLLLEGVCRQLGIVNYHSLVTPGNNQDEVKADDALVSTVRVQLVQTVKLRPQETVLAEVRLFGAGGKQSWSSEKMLLESGEQFCRETGGQIVSSLVQPAADGIAHVLLSNSLWRIARGFCTHRCDNQHGELCQDVIIPHTQSFR